MEIDIKSYYAKQLQLELVRASYILIIYLTEKQPGFSQSEIEKFITYITSWPARHATDEDIPNEELKFEGLQLDNIINTIANLKVIVRNTSSGLSLNSDLEINPERLGILDQDLFEHMLF